jgi:hypothetical protein
LFLVTGGKPYYLARLYPVLLAASAQPVLDWVHHRSTALRAGLIAVALTSTATLSVRPSRSAWTGQRSTSCSPA